MCKKLPTRKEIRLKEYDYSKEGYYYITICTKDRKEILGKINNNSNNILQNVGANCVRPKMNLSKIGNMVDTEINNIDKIYNNVKIDEYVIMPNHIHIIIEIFKIGGRTQFAPTISQIIKQFKGKISKKIGQSIWQKSFYEHVIRDEKEYLLIKQYILDNVKNYKIDKYL